ncbi:hypothetical protein H9Q13_13825 [Pontibacter sp. JH31]|uniref:Toxin-antitoxin system YwqK family antitoxin n=1 Tax=Pontibacter aquaedesilientis TaxID=2766980 RepID=A0ABR7XIZ6_9BACT|nr:hypothetical protein [Pontibacter aquaedesilientis]MBD1398244.1 hypothetical protein [Pontibacter aquaedesilientis]
MLTKKFSYYFLLVLMMILNIRCDTNKQRIVKYYYDDGGIESEIQVTGNRMNGISKYYYPSGKLHLVASYVNHKLDGEGREYFEDGSLKSVKNFKDDLLHGWVMEYDEGEILMNRTEYSNGRIVFNVSFYPTGDTLAIHENGRTLLFFETGKVKHVLCATETEVFSAVQFNENGDIVKRKGQLDCLSKNDSILLETQYPDWHKKEAL